VIPIQRLPYPAGALEPYLSTRTLLAHYQHYVGYVRRVNDLSRGRFRTSSEALQAATPDLITAFSGGASTHVDMPSGLFGLPIPDLAILLFLLAGLAAVPFLIAVRATSEGGGA